MPRLLTILTCSVLFFSGTLLAQLPVVPQGGVVNGASFRPSNAPGGAVAPGSIVSIFGSNLATAVTVAPSLPLPISLGGTSLKIGGINAPLFFVSAGQINAQVPWGVATGTAQLTVTTAAGTSSAVNLSIADSAPGVFSQTSDGRGPGAVLNYVPETKLNVTNTPGVTINPAGIVIIYGTGFGKVNSPPADGTAASGQPTVVTPTVTIGGRPATVQFSGLAPGFVGLYQINAVIPAGTPEGCYLPVTVSFGSAVANTVTIGVTNSRGDCNIATSGSNGMYLNGSFGWAGLARSSIQMNIPDLPPGFTIPGLNQPVDTFGASFRKFEARVPSALQLYPPVNGGCLVWLFKGDSLHLPDVGIVQDKPLNAGTLTLTGPGVSQTIAPDPKSPGNYTLQLPANSLKAGAWTLTGSGGSDVGSFTSTLTIPGLFSMGSFGVKTDGTFSQSTPLQLSWTCGDPSGQVGVEVLSVNDPLSLVGMAFCSFACAPQSGQVPVDVLKQLPVSSDAGAMVMALFSPGPAGAPPIKASGINFGNFSYGISAGVAGVKMVQ